MRDFGDTINSSRSCFHRHAHRFIDKYS